MRFGRAGTSYIDPGSPWQEPRGRVLRRPSRDELLAIGRSDTLVEVRCYSKGRRLRRPRRGRGILASLEREVHLRRPNAVRFYGVSPECGMTATAPRRRIRGPFCGECCYEMEHGEATAPAEPLPRAGAAASGLPIDAIGEPLQQSAPAANARLMCTCRR